MEEKTLEEIIARYDSPTGKVLGILGDIQRSEGYIPRETLEMLSVKIDVRISQLYSIVTFYSFFSLKPVGEHVITICMGTACHVRGAVGVLDALESLLDIHGDTTEDGKFSVTTKDNKFTVEIARCFGACSMAPVLQIDGTLYGYANPDTLPAILEQYGWRAA
ncbi:NAD(P)H-dependent oxidoreductase subunit E [Methanoregula sp.]|jgi:NADH-quinone oxidoreductase subunit E|uniref:NADH-quinone oxidoreductase subunit NuoE family protein n=1 Tax=Methanoregula sp. TaxID=2052170 RepID=UPI0025E8F091|nr:NAD(P)H-dependent oxidoreductase subunit E [Methanoregula sp.]